MALERVRDILKEVDKANTSVIAFNCLNFSEVHSVCTVAEELKKPVIIMLYPKHATDFMATTPEAFAAMALAEIKMSKAHIGLHLDHCSDFDFIKRAIDAGFTSVMYDGSMLSAEENLKNTKEVVEYAHKKNVDVEAELGRVGFAVNEKDQDNEDMYTKPETAKKFCQESGCDSVAVAIGSAHGFYTKTPKLDIERLEKINEATDTPLVLHGGSGIPEDQLNIAFTKGINKFNVGTEFLRLDYTATENYMKKMATDNKVLIQTTFKPIQDELMNYLRNKMQLTKM